MPQPQWLYLLRPTRPEMLTTGPTDAELATVGRHAAHMDQLGGDDVMRMVGQTQTTSPNTLGLAVYVADDEAAARRIMESDPAIKEGVMTAELFPYNIGFVNADAFRAALDAAG